AYQTRCQFVTAQLFCNISYEPPASLPCTQTSRTLSQKRLDLLQKNPRDIPLFGQFASVLLTYTLLIVRWAVNYSQSRVWHRLAKRRKAKSSLSRTGSSVAAALAGDRRGPVCCPFWWKSPHLIPPQLKRN